MNENGTVVVGIDGTPASDEALCWAAEEASRSGAGLRVVLAYRWRLPGGLGVTDRLEEMTREQAEVMVEAAVDLARARRPGLDVGGHAVLGAGLDVLLSESAGADLLVVGSHGRNALSAALHGSVGLRVAMRAPGRVAVVRGRVATEGPVVVGVDGSPTDERLLATAFEAAARRGCDVVAIRVIAPPAGPWATGNAPPSPGPRRTRTALLAELTDDLRRWHAEYPRVEASARLLAGDPAGELLAASGQARLLVLGGRAHGPAAGLLAGSVAQRLLHHAECPVLLVHGPGRR